MSPAAPARSIGDRQRGGAAPLAPAGRRARAAIVVVAMGLVAGACASASSPSGLPAGVRLSAFRPIAHGVELARGHADFAFGLDGDQSRSQDLTAVRVDLSSGVGFTTAPAGGPDDPARPGHQVVTTGTTVSDALRQRPTLTLAVNANFFWPCCQGGGAGAPVGMSLFGLSVDGGKMVSDPRAVQQKTGDGCASVEQPAVPTPDATGSTALVIRFGEHPTFVPASAADPPIDPVGVIAAVAGGPQPVVAPATPCGPGDQYPPLPHVPGPALLLTDGKTSTVPSADPPELVAGRTFVGLSTDRRYLYLATIDGSDSSGAAFADEAAWLQLLGAGDGLNLDGGGSSTMAINESHLNPGADLQSPPCPGSGVRLLDDPHGVVVGQTAPPCTERLVGNYLGIVDVTR